MKKIALVAVIIGAVAGLIYGLGRGRFWVLQPAGLIASQEHRLLLFGVGLAAVVLVPMFALMAWIAWKYRASNSASDYEPNWENKPAFSIAWWVLVGGAIAVMSVMTWTSTHLVDPQKVLAASRPPITIQVVALQWKWLFIYPDQGVATVNYLAIPAQTSVNFELTAQAPMNSFWIPQLGGQMYAMEGMETRLHLLANQPGTFQGSAVEINGAGYADMKFKTVAMSDTDFNTWLASAKAKTTDLSWSGYQALAKPNLVQPAIYGQVMPQLFGKVITQFMAPMTNTNQSSGTNSDSGSSNSNSNTDGMSMPGMSM